MIQTEATWPTGMLTSGCMHTAGIFSKSSTLRIQDEGGGLAGKVGLAAGGVEEVDEIGYIHTNRHTDVHTYKHIYIHACIHTCIHTKWNRRPSRNILVNPSEGLMDWSPV